MADYWNGRVQVLHIDDSGTITPKTSWNVEGWDDKSKDYKPFLCLHNEHIFVAVPAHNRVEEFSTQDGLINTLDINQTGFLKDGMPTGIAGDPNGGIWVSDYKNNLWLDINP